MRDELVDAPTVALAFGGWTLTRLRVWRHRHPHLLPMAARGRRGVALYRWTDVRHAATTVLEQPDTHAVTSESV